MEGSNLASNTTEPPFIDLESPVSQKVPLWNSNASPFVPFGNIPPYANWQQPLFPVTMLAMYPTGSTPIPPGISNAASENSKADFMKVKAEEAAKKKGTQRTRKSKRKVDVHDLTEEQVD